MIRPRQTLGRLAATGALGALLLLSEPGRISAREPGEAPPLVSSALLTEDGDELLTEDGDVLEWE